MTSMTIRMGAAHWDATIHAAPGSTMSRPRDAQTRFDFRKMNTDQRKLWYRTFMDSVRAVYAKGEDQPRRRRRGRAKPRFNSAGYGRVVG